MPESIRFRIGVHAVTMVLLGLVVIFWAIRFGRRHAQEMVLIAKKLKPGENDIAARLGLTVTLRAAVPVEEAVVVAELVKACGFQGATFAPKRDGEVAIYHTDTLGMTAEGFVTAAAKVVEELKKRYSQLTTGMQKFIIHMPRL
jgi:hypothetical protein